MFYAHKFLFYDRQNCFDVLVMYKDSKSRDVNRKKLV